MADEEESESNSVTEENLSTQASNKELLTVTETIVVDTSKETRTGHERILPNLYVQISSSDAVVKDAVNDATAFDNKSIIADTIDDPGQKLLKSLKSLKQENEFVKSDLNIFKIHMTDWLNIMQKTVQDSISSLESTVQRDGQEKKELLSEMTSMNEELNRRGETVSSLKEVISMYEKKVIDLNSQQDCSLNTINQLRAELTDRTQRLHDLVNQQETNSNIIYQLREELRNTRERLQDLDNQQNVSNNTIKQLRDQLADNSYQLTSPPPLDNHAEDRLSTSTVSRVEEASRLKDVEDSFEDRYCKLKVVAVKLKKRASETQQLLDSEKLKWAAEKNELVNKLNQLNGSARNNQTLQLECDRLADELEAERKESKMLRKAATDIKTSEVNLKVKLEECQTNIELLKANLDTTIQERDGYSQTLAKKEAELDAAKKEKLTEELIKKDKIKELCLLEEKLKEEREKVMDVQKLLENVKMEARKQTVLSLEIQNYEKSLSDMSGQLSAEKGRVSSLEAEVQTLQDIRDSLQEQIKLLEERVTLEEARNQQIQDQLVQSTSCLQETEDKVADLEKRVTQLNERLESERASAESATLELASLSSAIQTNTDIMLQEKQDLSSQVASLSSQLETLSSTLEQTEEELTAVRADFDKYKVRAQSVLRRHQTAPVSQAETEAKQQVDELRQLVATLTGKLDDSVIQTEKMKTELDKANIEREAAEIRCVNLNISLAEKSKQLERAVAEHRSQKLSLDTLVQCYKSQMQEKEKAAQEQLVKLTEELETLRKQLRESRELTLPNEKAMESDQSTAISSKFEPPMLEREDGEGSEYIPDYSPSGSPTPTTNKPLLPLEKLLETNYNLHGEEEQVDGELSTLRADLERNRKRSQHQAALLAEVEQDAARKEQLIAVLKKEIGHLERCLQRQPHAQNTEYLKNIVFKFVTLETGEDRMRLVPVITTLLQLSPEENQRLTFIAKGQNADSTGWGSYLPSWR